MGLPRPLRLAVLVLLVVLLILYPIWRQSSYERSLAASSISFADFPPDYADALKQAQRENKNPEYDWPPLPHPAPEAQTTIPPIIHFIWFRDLYHEHLDISEIPHIGSKAPEHCMEHNPDYEVITWNETAARALVEEHYSWLLPLYDGYRYPIQRIDAFKYVVLWHYGGVYMDLDIACRRKLDPLLPFAAWYPKASPFGVNNDLMASRARHPFVGYMLKQLAPRNWNLLFPYLTIFWSTGPQFTSDMLASWFWYYPPPNYPAGEKKLEFGSDTVFVLPQEFYSEQYTFFGHSPGGTWHGPDVAVVLWFVDHPWVLVVFAIGCLVLLRFGLKWRKERRLRNKTHRPASP
ncbi:hypothetical protein KC332_g9744 [Hortaea werneckii]|nr:hypothetical protein KC358_g10207 [Hortaea werneckii]OTA22080.1 hypothetical protein BTJ68_14750 [Hortaea werneckii EXF-2000]KAI6818788.1 hypothetical protein KC342_g14373 [Hortaea werneckii]KAI6825227.1 hypothetical protein KC350_g8838 [Hortaea werneckii]KAI6920526.1 hypothetical protein KC348_g10359 [Hortaea werneckii]